jgi:crotonobetainyl-CoA:carnitine CoA-transferase CaiB-like acyl-CoA transferase
MFEALGEWMGFPRYFTGYGGEAPPRSGPYHATIVPYGPFRRAMAARVFLSVQNEREFAASARRFCEDGAGGRSAVCVAARAASRTAGACMPRSTRVRGLELEELVRRLEQADIANARLNTWRILAPSAARGARGAGAEVGPRRATLRC